jgi:radical SAM superfamily enzyme YgiQ (UPF0313 family)
MLYPKIPDTYWSFKHALPFIKKKSSFPPLGLMTIAAMLPDTYEVKLVDLNVSALDRRDLLECDMVFLSAMIIQQESFRHLVKLSNMYNKPVIAGGPYPIASHDKIEGVDHFVLDEAEITLPQFLRDWEASTPQTIYRSNGVKPDITNSPVPRFDIIDIDSYNSMSLQFSRGCPFNCEFCDIIEMFGRYSRTKKPEQFIREMEAVYAAGFRGSIFIVDDNFIGNKKEVKKLLTEIITWQKAHHYPFTFFTEASINLAGDDELLQLMADAALDMVFIGIETPDKETLAFTQKGQNLKESTYESVKRIQEAGIEVTGGFIVGFDTDKEDIFERQRSFIQKAGIPMAMVGLLTALPNTQLFRRLKREDRLLTEEISGNNTHEFGLNFIPKMSLEKIRSGYKQLISDVFSPSSYFHRCLTLLKRKPASKEPPKRITREELRALILSLVKQTFSWYGFQYILFLVRTVLYKPQLFHTAIVFAVKGHHLFKITKQILRQERRSPAL